MKIEKAVTNTSGRYTRSTSGSRVERPTIEEIMKYCYFLLTGKKAKRYTASNDEGMLY